MAHKEKHKNHVKPYDDDEEIESDDWSISKESEEKRRRDQRKHKSKRSTDWMS